jgi:lipoprotein-anchoring transpeptidase ErfK/SrfK
MQPLSRRALLRGASATTALWALAGCATQQPVVLREVDPRFRRQAVAYAAAERTGTIVINPAERFLYRVEDGGRAMRYGVAVGGEGFGWSGVATVQSKQEWPDWYPTAGILERHPQLRPAIRPLPSGQGMAGGPDNPLGARALYLWQNNKDTLYRIHGTNEPWSIGTNVSSGCIRLVNDDVIDLYERTPIGAKVVVLPSAVS